MGFDDIYHMTSVFHDQDDAQWWIRAADAKWNHEGTFGREDWDKLLGHCQGNHSGEGVLLLSADTSLRLFATYLLLPLPKSSSQHTLKPRLSF